MTHYVLLYIGGTYPETPEEQQAVMGAWGAWYGKMGDAIIDGGKPFGPGKTVTAKGVDDGPGMSPAVTGYTVISADSLDAAVALCKDHPHCQFGGQVSVNETFDMEM
ncbi:MAG: hypothetical protein J5I90_04440 [Caldilineales bacterium]|nr:hypothetical protein [Caldilineales bacterium]